MTMIYKSPHRAPASLAHPSVFLAGSIEMGRAEKWQPRLGARFAQAGACVFDPRRDNWDASWHQDPTPGTPFEQQVSWELDHIHAADLVYFRISDDGPAIISMLEMGLIIGARRRVVIHADPGYMRRGNIVITGRRFGVPVFAQEEEAFAHALHLLDLG